VLIYAPRNPVTLNIYEQSMTTELSASSSRCQSAAVFALPLSFRFNISKSALTNVSRGTASSLRQLGGIRVFIYLFAKVWGVLISLSQNTCNCKTFSLLVVS
jgi:hypothetical protein